MDMQVLDLGKLAAKLGPDFAARAGRHDADDSFVAENYAALKTHKVFSAMVPRDLGGGGASHREMCGFIRAIALSCSSTALALSMHQHLVAAAVYNHLNGKPGKALLEKVAANETVLISTGAGDWLASKGTVTKAEGGYRVTARKSFSSGAPAGAVLVTSAPYEDPEAGWQVLHFPVPMSAEGVSIGEDWRAHGMRGTGSHTVKLENVFVPEAAVALKRPRGVYHPVWNVILTVAMPLITSAYVGIAEAAARLVLDFARARANEPTLPYLLGEMENRLTTAQLALDAMIGIADGWRFEATNETANAILVRKTIAVEAARATVGKALEATSGAGYFRAFGLERLLRDVTAGQFHPLPEKKQQLFTGRLALGLEPVEAAA